MLFLKNSFICCVQTFGVVDAVLRTACCDFLNNVFHVIFSFEIALDSLLLLKPFKRQVKSHLPFAGIIRSSPYTLH